VAWLLRRDEQDDIMKFKKNQPVWVEINGKKYRGFYFGKTVYGTKHWVNSTPQKGMGAGWRVDESQISSRMKNE
jgi:hypothetical protein